MTASQTIWPMPQRLVVINDDSVPSGGAAAIALASAELMAKRGLPVTFLTGDEGAGSPLPASGVNVVPFGGHHIMEGNRALAALRGLYDGRAAAFVEDWIQQHDTPGTIYHLHNWHKFLSPAVFRPLKKVASRLFLSIHDYFLVCPNGGYFHFPERRPCDLKPLSLRCLGTNCDKRHVGHKVWRSARLGIRHAAMNFAQTEATVLTVHEGMTPYMTRGGVSPEVIRVLRNPVSPWRQQRVVAEANKQIFFVGRIELDKGVDVLCRAARKANAPLTVIGDGPLLDDLRQGHPEVTFMGWQNRLQVAAAMADARMLVLPSRWRETFGLVALEATTSGIPVVISNHALIASDLVTTGAAQGCNPADENGLAAILSNLADDNEQIAAMSQAGFHTTRSLAHTSESWGDALLALYAERLKTAGTVREQKAASKTLFHPRPVSPG
jgi:glycosyltransferase involved in cell wall biosynthesis